MPLLVIRGQCVIGSEAFIDLMPTVVTMSFDEFDWEREFGGSRVRSVYSARTRAEVVGLRRVAEDVG